QFPLGGGARAEGGQALELCCAWGRTLSDGDLTYSVTAADPATAGVIRAAVREWDDVLAVAFTEVAPSDATDVQMRFTESAGRTEGQAVTSFTQRGLIRRVEITIKGGLAPENSGGIIQIAKHEFGHALGLGHANFDGNLMSEAVSPEPSPIPTCAVSGVLEANRWKMVDPESKRPHAPRASEVSC
ncbi:MAG: matrixin family metalloprotease, partial [Acidimicrobiia bacterium]